MKVDREGFESMPDEKKMELIKLYLGLATHNGITREELLMLLGWLYRKVKLDEKTIKQAICHCYMVERFEYPGMEEGLCAGLRTNDGDGEPCENCKECRLQYQYDEMHEEAEG